MALQAPPQLHELVDQHREMADEPLLLAIYYQPSRDEPQEKKDIFLFEVIENFGSGRINEDQELFELAFGPATGFPMDPDQRVNMVLTHPREFGTAVERKWKHAVELIQAVQRNDYEKLYEDPGRTDLFKMIREAADGERRVEN